MFKVFLIIFVFSLVEEASGFDTKVSHFQIFQKHPNLKKCASTSLQENEYAGVRVSEKTGKCEPLRRYWWRHERGYAYATKVFEQETFQPPVDACAWQIPGMLNTGARLDMFIRIKNPEVLDLSIELFGTSTDFYKRSFHFSRRHFSYHESINNEHVVALPMYVEVPAQFTTMGVVKVSLLTHSASVTMLVEDEVFFTAGVNYILYMNQLQIYNWKGEGIGIRRIEFTGK